MSFDESELLEKSPLGIVICDAQQRINWCNDRFTSETSLQKDQVIGQLYASLPLEAIDKKAQVVQLFQKEVREEVKFQYWQAALDSKPGFVVHYFTRERQTKNKFGLAAKISGAQLPKRASWVEFLDYEVSRSRRYDNPLSILKLHLLVFGKPETVSDATINDTVTDTLTDILRWADMIGHTDHDTYLLVLPETHKDALSSLKDKLMAALKRQLGFVSEDIQYQVVFGDACWQKHDDSQLLLKRARASLVEQLEKIIE